MKITYRREMKHNYLIINPDEPEYKGFELHMLEKNSIEGLLRFHVKNLDGQNACYYEITSKQSLSRILEYKSLGEEELKRLIGGIARTLSRMEAYLLKEDQILLEPEYIYVEPERFNVFLCLVPGRKGTFTQEMTGLLRYLLGKVNHQDKECVVMAYGLYQESLKENYGIDDLLKITEKQTNYGEHVAPVEKNHKWDDLVEHHGEIPTQIVTSEEEVYESIISQKHSENDTGISLVKVLRLIAFAMAGTALILWFVSGINGISRFWYAPFVAGLLTAVFILFSSGKNSQGKKRESISMELSKNEDIKEVEPKRDNLKKDNVKRDSIKKDSVKRGSLKKEELIRTQGEEYDWQMAFIEEGKELAGPPEIEEDEEVLQTVLLTDTTADNNARYLRAVGSEVPDITISYVPYLIGKQEGLVDYVLDSETISRIHVRIDRNGEEYQLCDLNSTNGTLVNGRMLETNETVTLKKGDEIFIANFAFIFT